MTNEEVKQALANGKPVIYFVPLVGDVRYDRVSAVIYRIINGELAVTAELEDRKGRSTATVRIDRLRVEGHTDQSGTRKYNEELSLRRARAVADLLVAAGILPGNVEVQGFGFDRPLVQNGSHADHQENRRVAIVVPAH